MGIRALVSGGNRGLGVEICRIILEGAPNAQVFLGCRDLQAGAEVARSLTAAAKDGGCAEAVLLDVTSGASIANAVASISGHLDLLVNNAGVLHEVWSADTVAETMATNFDGVVGLTTACLPLLTAAPGGAQVLSTSSGMGARAMGLLREEDRDTLSSTTLDELTLRRTLARIVEEMKADAAHPYHESIPTPAYALSKLGVNCYTQMLARTFAPDRLRANVCSPGFTNTGMCANYTGTRKPKEVPLGASVFAKVLFGELGAARPTGLFFKESSKPGTPLKDATSGIDPWSQ